jgi:CRP-like cAMP-binding protein
MTALPSARGASGTPVSLIAAWPELLAAVPVAERPLAERVLTAPLVRVSAGGDLSELQAPGPQAPAGLLILAGVVLKETRIVGRAAFEVFAEGDVLVARASAAREADSGAVSRYVAHGEVDLVALDGRFREAARRWPGLSDALHETLARQAHRSSMQLAVLHLPRAEDRIVAVLADLGERLGRMTAEGIVFDLKLTHELLGGLAGARRPTVSLGLQRLAADGLVVTDDGRRWLIARDAVGSWQRLAVRRRPTLTGVPAP